MAILRGAGETVGAKAGPKAGGVGVAMVRFGAFTFDAAARKLWRGSAVIHLPPKVFDLLAVLVDAAPRVVGKRELHQRLWPGGAVTDATLSALVKHLRRALGDGQQTVPLVRTVNRVGYALDAQVQPQAEAPAAGVMQRWLLLGLRRQPLAEGECIVGRDTEAQVRIEAVTVSRRHARLQISAAGCLIEDLGSKNGTCVDGQRLDGAPVALRDGSQLLFGTVAATYREAGLVAPTLTLHGVTAEQAAKRRG